MESAVQGRIEIFDGVSWVFRDLEELTTFEEIGTDEEGFRYGLIQAVPIRFLESPVTIATYVVREELVFA